MNVPNPDLGIPRVDYTPPHIVQRRVAAWRGLWAEAIELTQSEPYEYDFQAPFHLLIAPERSERYDGETCLEGLPKSSLRELSRRMTFVPAGRRFRGWQKPRVLSRVNLFYIDPRGPFLDPELAFDKIELKPQLFFFDPDMWATALKLKSQITAPYAVSSPYAEALGAVLCHELIRLNGGAKALPRTGRQTGLAPWQQKRVADYIETRLDARLTIADMAALVHLSPFHFSRAFKQSFGMPPHRYHMMRRVEAAKTLLNATSIPMTEIALQLGFSEASSLSAGFRRVTGVSPSAYRWIAG
jgi:AraC family transcriptional regulator